MILATASFLLSAAQPTLAFVARFYQSGDAKSQFELYVSDISGNSRKMLKTSVEPNFVQWMGKDRLVWTTAMGVYTSKLSPWNPVLVKGSKTIQFRESRWRSNEPGFPEFTDGWDESKGFFALNARSMKFEQTANNPAFGEIALSDGHSVDANDPNHPTSPLKLTKYETFEYVANGKKVSCEWDALRAWGADGDRKLWILMGTHDSTTGDHNGVMLFEKGKEPRTIFDNANLMDFVKNRDLYAYCSSRETKTLGKKEVWTSELHVGDWKKGTNKTVLTGLVWVPSVSMRP